MIDEKKIKEAATKYAGKRPKDLLSTERQSSFKDGAEWAQREFVKSLWHDASEEPNLEDDSMILINIPDNKMSYMVLPLRTIWNDWENAVSDFNIIRWLYINDLLPKNANENK